MKIPKLKYRIQNIFGRRNVLAISLFTALSRSFAFTWIFWDALLSNRLYKYQKIFPDHALRFLRLGVGLTWFAGIISPITAGIYLIGDGIYSIARYRILKVTKSPIEDLPRLARIGCGLLMFPLFAQSLPFLLRI
jgi:predicted helicase